MNNSHRTRSHTHTPTRTLRRIAARERGVLCVEPLSQEALGAESAAE